MPITVLTATTQAAAVNYNYSTSGTTDWSGITNNIFFYDLVTRLPYFKDSGGNVQNIFFTGGTVVGATIFTNGLTGNTISATTYQNLPLDITVTGGTYSNGSVTFTNNTGGTFNVSGFYTGATDVFVTGSSYNNNTFTYTNNTGGTFNVLFNTMTGLTVNGNLTATTISATTISATTYQNLPTDIRVTGGTYNQLNGITTFTNNTGGTFNITGYTTPFTGGTVTGATNFTNGLTANTINVNLLTGSTSVNNVGIDSNGFLVSAVTYNITSGVSSPSGGTDGDIYLQYTL